MGRRVFYIRIDEAFVIVLKATVDVPISICSGGYRIKGVRVKEVSLYIVSLYMYVNLSLLIPGELRILVMTGYTDCCCHIQ